MSIRSLLVAFALLALPVRAEAAPAMKLWRLDCGHFEISDFDVFSDTGFYKGQKRSMTDSCYLIQHGADYFLWDTGLDAAIKGKPVTDWVFTESLDKTIAEQLATLGIKPEAIKLIGISHYHDDHLGQLRGFPWAKLLMGAGDLAGLKASPPVRDIAPYKPWLQDGASVEGVSGDKDVFGDGTVVMIATPGHTPGHMSLLVRLPKTGAVMLSGDLYHAATSYARDEVPAFAGTNRADTLASFDRFKKMAANFKATVIIQHEPTDIAKLPVFPQAAE